MLTQQRLCSIWYTTDKTSMGQYTNDFRQYEYNLCKSCMETVVNGLTVEQWIKIDKMFVQEALACIFEANDSQSKGREDEGQRFYDSMLKSESVIKTIRRNMIKRIIFGE